MATRLHVSERQLHRVLVAEVGVGPLELARTRRAQTARLLLERTNLSITDVAFAAGFGSLRQFNEVIREQFGRSPSALRSSSSQVSTDGMGRRADGRLNLRLPVRLPFDAEQTLVWVAARAVPGVERVDVERAQVLRVLRLPGGPGVARLSLGTPEPRSRGSVSGGSVSGGLVSGGLVGGGLVGGGSVSGGIASGGTASVQVTLWLPELLDVARATAGLRAWLDLDADPTTVAQVLRQDLVLAPLLVRAPGLRLPGTPDPCEQAIRAVLGQQVSVAAARTAAGRLVAAFGQPVVGPNSAYSSEYSSEYSCEHRPELGAEADADQPPGLSAFPAPEALAEAGADGIRAAVPMPAAKARTLALVATELASGRLDLGPAAHCAMVVPS